MKRNPSTTARRRASRRKAEAGFSLIIAMVIFMLLLVLGTMAMQAVNTDQELTIADRSSMTALYLAETGVAWATDVLAQEPYTLTAANVADQHPTQIANGTSVTDTVACPDGAPCTDHDWYLLDAPPSGSVPGSGFTYTDDAGQVHGTYKVYASYEDLPGADAWVVRLRSLGTGPGGAKRMLEVQVGPAD